MKEPRLNTPILFIIFNRPDTTKIVFEEIRKIKPKKLFIAADGPREEKPGELKKCLETRKIVERIDWKCEVKTLFQEKNLGCGPGPVVAINWFFNNVEEGIILEDDCAPNQSFFYFCQELLTRYKNNEKIMHISGNNFQYGRKRGWASYYFSAYTHSWGWATWQRAWKYYNAELLGPEKRSHIWDYQWMMSVKNKKGLAILPNVNLVSNIGFNEEATHTKEAAPYSNLPAQNIRLPLVHPKIILRNYLADLFTYQNHFNGTVKKLFFKKMKEVLPATLKSLIKYPIGKIKEKITKRKLNFLYKKYCDFTMIPEKIFYDNLNLVKNFSNIDGCVVECGVWRGGMIAAISEILGNKRKYYLFDSFEGLPKAEMIDGEAALNWQKNTKSPIYFNNCMAEIKFSREAMEKSHANNYEIIKGWFSDTLPSFTPTQPIAILRLDSDWYDSTMTCLDNLYKYVNKGGIIIIDDYYTWDGCTKAVHDFLSKNKLSDRIYLSNKICYIIKN